MKTLTKLYLNASVALMAAASFNLSAAPLKINDIAPDFSAITITGKSIKLSELNRNKPVYLKFWATWCSYCVAEMPHLQNIYDQYGDDIEVITINVAMNDSIAKITKLFSAQGYNLPTVFDTKGKLTAQFGVVGTPHHILIDRNGKIAYRTFLASDTLDAKVDELINSTNNNLGQ